MIEKPKLTKRVHRFYHQGYFVPKHPEKYIGNVRDIIYRSKWELCFLRWLDNTNEVLKYSSEECVIPYISPVDHKQHRYFTDYFVIIQQKDKVQNYLIEIKPYAQTQPPKRPKVLTESYVKEVKTFMVNRAKWEAAENVCAQRGWKFMVITERELFNQRTPNAKRKNRA